MAAPGQSAQRAPAAGRLHNHAAIPCPVLHCRGDLPGAGLANVTATFLNLLGFEVGRSC